MMTVSHRRAVAVAVVAAVMTWWAFNSPSSPLAPKERPVVRFLAKVARFALWIALAAEKPPAEDQPHPHHHQAIAKFDENGNRILDHEEGW